MRMQEMITEFRAIMPKLTGHANSMNTLLDKLQATGVDLKICTNSHSKEVLVKDMLDTLSDALGQIAATLDCVRGLQELNEKYQHKVGHRVDKLKDDPRQMELALDHPEPAPDTLDTTCQSVVAGFGIKIDNSLPSFVKRDGRSTFNGKVLCTSLEDEQHTVVCDGTFADNPSWMTSGRHG